MKYHKYENQRRYSEMKEQGLTNRYEAHDGVTFLQQYNDSQYIVDLIKKSGINPPASVLVIGTGTGADACVIENKGYDVLAIDIINDAIVQAKENAKSINCQAQFQQDDILNPKHRYGQYDIIFSSSVLQSIVTDDDRELYYNFVIEHIKDNGTHIISTAGYSPNKDYSNNVRDEKSGIVYSKVPNGVELADTVVFENILYSPSRRHFTKQQLESELNKFGWQVDCWIDGGGMFKEYGSLLVVTSM